MDIKEVPNNERFLFNKAATHPLQSWEWGDFRKAAGNEVVRLAVYDKSKLVTAIQVVLHKIPFTNFKIGTLIKGPTPTQEILDALKGLAKKENILFIKMEPNVDIGESSKEKDKLISLLKKNDCVRGKTLFTPTTFWIGLTPSEEELMKSFHPKTRYNIRLAQKRGVTVIEDNSDEAFEKYLELTRETVLRQGFYAHTERYHRLMWKHLYTQPTTQNQQPIAHLLTARYQNEIITTWVLFVWHNFLYYPYGASTDKNKDVMANNLVMWEAIRYGKAHGLKTFDLWGREEGKGFTKFKEGYNPKVIEFLGTWDLPTSSLYPFYREAEKIRWKILRLKARFGITKPTL